MQIEPEEYKLNGIFDDVQTLNATGEGSELLRRSRVQRPRLTVGSKLDAGTPSPRNSPSSLFEDHLP